MTSCLGLVLCMALISPDFADAQERGRGKKGKPPAAGERPANPGNGAQNRNGPQNGMVGGGAQMAQMMIAQFDRDGDRALNAAELQMAMNAFMQRLQAQLQQRQRMGRGQGNQGQFGQGQFGGGGRGGAGGGRGGQGGAGGGPGGGRGGAGGHGGAGGGGRGGGRGR